jgi:hypothetical protein
MASGYEKHSDYGGKPPSVRGIIIIILLWLIITALMLGML